jgi:hypothetical protein
LTLALKRWSLMIILEMWWGWLDDACCHVINLLLIACHFLPIKTFLFLELAMPPARFGIFVQVVVCKHLLAMSLILMPFSKSLYQSFWFHRLNPIDSSLMVTLLDPVLTMHRVACLIWELTVN